MNCAEDGSIVVVAASGDDQVVVFGRRDVGDGLFPAASEAFIGAGVVRRVCVFGAVVTKNDAKTGFVGHARSCRADVTAAEKDEDGRYH